MSAPAAGKWGDLGPRIASAAVMIAIALMGIWLGGLVFAVMVAAICGLMVWELIRMVAPGKPGTAVQLALLGAVAVLLAMLVPPAFALPLVIAPAIVAARQTQDEKPVVAGYTALICVAGLSLFWVREELNIGWIFWLIILVVVSDVLGYFAGKTFGGPKFWPAISPKKTWSGTVAGWIAAAIVGAAFLTVLPGGPWLVLLSIAASFASQMGDIAESAVKRRVGVKDSSGLIPGHGGIFDRFDGMLGASVLVLIVMELTGYPPGGM